MNLFIDTNIFLSFFHYSSVDLEELNKLIVLLRNNRISLFLPEQVKAEFYRNRDNKIADALKRFGDDGIQKSFPQIVMQYEEFKELKESLKTAEEYKKRLLKKVQEDIANEKLKADTIIADLFDLSCIIGYDHEIIEKAEFRYRIGNPPGKDGSYGDAINWVALLHELPEMQDLHFISEDSDYYSKIENTRFNSFLQKEWMAAKQSSIFSYKTLSAFLKANFPEIKLANEFEKEIIIETLAKSSSFDQTHVMIYKLSKLDDFTKEQLNKIALASVTNNQIYWISQDEDVNSVLTNIVMSNKAIIEKDVVDRFLKIYHVDDDDEAYARFAEVGITPF